MTDRSRFDAPAAALGSERDREARVEDLLLSGLDHYFAGQHELAINVWTRVLFLDRGHARARAYIERARGAIAERQREGEELLHTGAAAFQRGEAETARRLLTSAVEQGAGTEEALALLDRLDRLEAAGVRQESRTERRRRAAAEALHPDSAAPRSIAGSGGLPPAWSWASPAASVAIGAVLEPAGRSGCRSIAAATAETAVRVRPTTRFRFLPPRTCGWRGRGRSTERGHLRDALSRSRRSGPGDPLAAEADQLQGRRSRGKLLAAGSERSRLRRPGRRTRRANEMSEVPVHQLRQQRPLPELRL